MVPWEGEQRRRRIITRLAQNRLRTHLYPPFSLPFTASKSFRDCSAAQRNLLLADITSATLAREKAVTGGTHDDESRAWRRWSEYCASIGLHDTYMDDLNKQDRVIVVGAFAMALRTGRFSRERHEPLAEGTVRNTISAVVQTFRATGRENPTRDIDNELSVLLSRQFRAYRNEDPKQRQQKALPIFVLANIAKRQITETERAIAQLTIGAFFFACRSCEYLKVPQKEQRRTKLLCLRNVRFFKDGRTITPPTLLLESADSVAITFEMQKNDRKHDTVTHGSTGDDTLCPVLQWARLINRIWAYPGATLDTPVCAVWRYDRIELLTSDMVTTTLRAAVMAIGSDQLGFTPDEIGTHSLRSGAAMQMYLGEIPVYTIMLIGRWSSDAFLRYIRKQVEQFSHDVSRKMLTFLSFRHIPDIAPRRISPNDPRQRNHRDNAETRQNIGRNVSRRVQLPAFALHA